MVIPHSESDPEAAGTQCVGIAGNRASPGCIILGSGVKFIYFCHNLNLGQNFRVPHALQQLRFSSPGALPSECSS